MKRRSRILYVAFTVLLAALSGILWSLFRSPGKIAKVESTAPAPEIPASSLPHSSALAANRSVAGPASAPVSTKQSWEIGEDGGGMSIVLALDEANIRNGDGLENFVKLDPPATLETLPERLAAIAGDGQALPVAYPEGEARTEENRYIVTRDLRVQIESADAERIAAANRLRVTEYLDYAPGWVLMAADSPFAALDAVSGVRGDRSVASADVLLAMKQFTRAAPNDPLYGDQWHLHPNVRSAENTSVNIEDLWNYGGSSGSVRGSGVRIGIVDDGFQYTHPDFVGGVDTVNDYDFNGQDDNPMPSNSDAHGTACGGVAAGRGNNSLGGIGAAPMATLVGYRLIAGNPTDAQIAAAMNYRNELVWIKNNSWGPSDGGNRLGWTGVLTRSALQNAVRTGRDGKGTIFTWAAGNGGAFGDNANYDAYGNSIYTIAVGALGSDGYQSYYSEPGSNLVVCAPSNGADLGITTTDLVGNAGYGPGDYTSTFGGTSSATPLVSGVIALILQVNPDLGWRDVQEILIRSAFQIDPTDFDWVTNDAGLHFNHRYGAGRVDATAAVELARDWTNVAQQVTASNNLNNLNLRINGTTSPGASVDFVVANAEMTAEHVTVRVDIDHPSRGALEISLISPSGIVSRLAEEHGDDTADYEGWTFSTVHNWGEDPNGTWTLVVNDASGESRGILNSARLEVFGASTAPPNPAPVVTIEDLESGAVFDSGTTLTVRVTATDLDAEGNAGTVTRVNLLDNGEVIATDTSAPYEFQITPDDGTHVLEATAVDSANLEGFSTQVVLGFGNQPPTILDAELTQEGQCYDDEELAVSSLTSSDYEDAELTISYQWQSSLDQVTYTDVEGATSESLEVDASNAGKIWRCVITAFDGEKTSEPFTTAEVNILGRPVLQADPGDAYEYASGLVLRGSPKAISHRAIVTEFSQGRSGGNSEWVEILMMETGSLSGWRLSGSGTSRLNFTASGVWDNIPAGTLITIYNGNSTSGKDPLVPADDGDASDFQMVVSSTSRTFFNDVSQNWIFLGDSGGAVILENADLTPVHQVSYGSNTIANLRLGAVGGGRAAYFAGDSEDQIDDPAFWTVTNAQVAPTAAAPLEGVTPGLPNNTAANATFVSQLRTGNYLDASLFRLADGVELPEGLAFDPTTGVISGTIAESATLGSYPIVIERYNLSDVVVSQDFVLIVGSLPGFDLWVAGFAELSDATPTGDADGDGLENVIEYLLGLDPAVAESASPFTLASDETEVSLLTMQMERPDYQMVAEWSESLDQDAEWSSEGILTNQIEGENGTVEIRYSLLIAEEFPRRFMRLVATPIEVE